MEFSYPSRKSSFEIQAQFFIKFQEVAEVWGLEIRGECESKFDTSKRLIRADLAIFKDKKAIVLVEIKNSGSRMANGRFKGSRQYQKYTSFGIPVFYCFGEENIDETIDSIFEQVIKPKNEI